MKKKRKNPVYKKCCYFLGSYITVRLANIFQSNNIETINDLSNLTIKNVLRFRNCGKKTCIEIGLLLANLGLEFSNENH